MSRAQEIAQFLGIPEADAAERLARGFGYQHQRVNDDFRRCNPRTDEELLNWYRTTEEYIWELSAYHADEGFNYLGMCSGIIERLKNEGARCVLCLGDGIGDLTLSLKAAGLDPIYHDLAGSKTAEFATYRINKINEARELDELMILSILTDSFDPKSITPHDPRRPVMDAIVSLDFLEHVTDVPAWCRAIHAALKTGGLFCAQNAFDCGSGNDGAIPCHLSINDKYAHAAPHTEGAALWDWLLIKELGFEQLGPNWYRKP
jgi:SAM-dependent methyltransferase